MLRTTSPVALTDATLPDSGVEPALVEPPPLSAEQALALLSPLLRDKRTAFIFGSASLVHPLGAIGFTVSASDVNVVVHGSTEFREVAEGLRTLSEAKTFVPEPASAAGYAELPGEPARWVAGHLVAPEQHRTAQELEDAEDRKRYLDRHGVPVEIFDRSSAFAGPAVTGPVSIGKGISRRKLASGEELPFASILTANRINRAMLKALTAAKSAVERELAKLGANPMSQPPTAVPEPLEGRALYALATHATALPSRTLLKARLVQLGAELEKQGKWNLVIELLSTDLGERTLTKLLVRTKDPAFLQTSASAELLRHLAALKRG